jgi:hypothetical protein
MINQNIPYSGSLEFSRRVNIPVLAKDPAPQTCVATQSECNKLAERFGLPGIKSFTAQVKILPTQNAHTFKVEGKIQAEVIYICVVSLKPFPGQVEDNIIFNALKFSQSSHDKKEIELDLSGGDFVDEEELDADDFLDLGEVLAQYLSLALDPYPRDPAEVEEGPIKASPSARQKGPIHKPFETLKALIKSEKDTEIKD